MYAVRLSGVLSDGEPGYASQCVACGECLEKCPQQIEIPDFMEDIVEEMEDDQMEARLAMAKKMFNVDS